jgi:hypothetical protein
MKAWRSKSKVLRLLAVGSRAIQRSRNVDKGMNTEHKLESFIFASFICCESQGSGR